MTTTTASVALMYHGILRTKGLGTTRYSITESTFRHQMKQVKLRGGGISADAWLGSSPSRPAILLTFDDGLASDYEVAFPTLRQSGMRADFFVNAATVGTTGHVSWAMLREMSAAGMSVQSHGYTHDYLTALSPGALLDSLRRSRETIEHHLGTAVRLLAPPGGRMPSGLEKTAKAAGFAHVLCSRPGYLKPGMTSHPLPRMAVTSSTPINVYCDWLDRRLLPAVNARTRYAVLGAAKNVLGDTRYEQIRRLALSPRSWSANRQ